MSDEDDSPRLYLMLPAGLAPADAAKRLGDALSGGDIACVFAPTSHLDEDAARALVKACLPLCEDAGAALLVSDPALKSAGCDGVHLDLRNAEPAKALVAAAKLLKPKFILGAGGLRNRHSAMEAGECDVDYVMFGEPAPDGFVPPLAQTLERVEWWTEIFNVPCVAYSASLADIAELAAASPEFIAVRDVVWQHEQGAAAGVREALQAIASSRARAEASR